MALLMDQSRSVVPLRSAKAREFGELWRENARAQFLSAGQNGPMEGDVRTNSTRKISPSPSLLFDKHVPKHRTHFLLLLSLIHHANHSQ